MDRRPVRHGQAGPRDRQGLRIQPGFQGRVIHVLGQGPGQSRGHRPSQHLGHGTARHPTTLGDLPVAELARPVESQYVFDLSHRHSLRWHRLLLPLSMEGARYRRLRRTCVAIRAEPDTADRRPSFRGMSATDSEGAQTSGRIPVGISGRVPSEWVADLRRNQWPGWVGIRTPETKRGSANRLLGQEYYDQRAQQTDNKSKKGSDES